MALAGGMFWESQGPDIPEQPGYHAFPFSLIPNGAWVLTNAHAVPGIIASGALYALWVFVILGVHEMGHYAACRYYRIPVTLPFFLPGPPPLGSFGAVIRIRGVIPNRKALFDIAAAGPIAGFVVALPVLIAGLLRATPTPPEAIAASATGYSLGQPGFVMLFGDLFVDMTQSLSVGSLFGAGWVGMLVTSLNLFPVGQLDGGHAAYALSRRTHRITARATLAGMVALMVVQIAIFGQFPGYLLWFGILLWMRDRHPRLLDEDAPLGTGRKLVAILLVIMFICAFIPVPFIIDGQP
jgi:membrane-associated protease RseP (regulator of RpoE activity)